MVESLAVEAGFGTLDLQTPVQGSSTFGKFVDIAKQSVHIVLRHVAFVECQKKSDETFINEP